MGSGADKSPQSLCKFGLRKDVDNMKMESDDMFLIFTPNTEADYFLLGRIHEKHKNLTEYAVLNGQQLSGFKISKADILKIILQESI